MYYSISLNISRSMSKEIYSRKEAAQSPQHRWMDGGLPQDDGYLSTDLTFPPAFPI